MTKKQVEFGASSVAISIEMIKDDIALRSAKLKEKNLVTVIYVKWYRRMKSIFMFFVRIHRNFSKNDFYMKTVGALVLSLRGKRKDFKTVLFTNYLSLQDEEFIVDLYKDVLKREVDLQSFTSMMAALKSSVESRIDIGYDLNLSNEVTLTKMYIEGVYHRKVVLDIKRNLMHWFSGPVSLLTRIKNRLLKFVRRKQQ